MRHFTLCNIFNLLIRSKADLHITLLIQVLNSITFKISNPQRATGIDERYSINVKNLSYMKEKRSLIKIFSLLNPVKCFPHMRNLWSYCKAVRVGIRTADTYKSQMYDNGKGRDRFCAGFRICQGCVCYILGKRTLLA